MVRRFVLAASFAFASTGCIPAAFTVVPGVTCKVVDADVDQPIAGAQLLMYSEDLEATSSQPVSESNLIARIYADRNGNADLNPQTRWALLFVGMDFIQERLRVKVEATGFQTAFVETNFTEAPSADRFIVLRTIRLRRMSASQRVGE
jgi:hypothetical protein